MCTAFMRFCVTPWYQVPRKWRIEIVHGACMYIPAQHDAAFAFSQPRGMIPSLRAWAGHHRARVERAFLLSDIDILSVFSEG
jgi:hypothetical protein